jgi:hypothetical protein
LDGTSPKQAAQNWVGAHFVITGISNTYFPDVVGDADFSLQSAAPLTLDGEELVRIEFTARPKEWSTKARPKGTGWLPLRKGWIVFDPERYWVIRECHVELQNSPQGGSTGSMHGKFEYKEGRKGFPIVKRTVRKWDGGYQYTQEFDLTERDDVPESDFTLSAYGLPEPPEVQQPRARSWLYLWVGLAGMICLALGVGFRWRSKRASA